MYDKTEQINTKLPLFFLTLSDPCLGFLRCQRRIDVNKQKACMHGLVFAHVEGESLDDFLLHGLVLNFRHCLWGPWQLLLWHITKCKDTPFTTDLTDFKTHFLAQITGDCFGGCNAALSKLQFYFNKCYCPGGGNTTDGTGISMIYNLGCTCADLGNYNITDLVGASAFYLQNYLETEEGLGANSVTVEYDPDYSTDEVRA